MITLLLVISSIILIIMNIYLLLLKNKTQIHYAFLSTISLMFINDLGCILENYYIKYYNYNEHFFVNFAYFGFTLLPVAFLCTSMIFSHSSITFKKILILLIIPIISNIVLWSNNYHHLFFKNYYSLDNYNNLLRVF